MSGTCSLTSAFPFCFVLGLLHGSGGLQCQLYPDGDCHLHQPGPAVAGAAHPGLLRGPIPDQSPPSLWSPDPLCWGLLQGWSREDHDGRQSSEHRQEGQGGTGEELFSTVGGMGWPWWRWGAQDTGGSYYTEFTICPQWGTLAPSHFHPRPDSDSPTPRNALRVCSLRHSYLMRVDWAPLCSLAEDLIVNASHTQPATAG